MTDEVLRQACEEFANLYMDDAIMKEHNGLQVLLAFARQMQAVGIRQASDVYWIKAGLGKAKIVDGFFDWCEAEAKRLEAPLDMKSSFGRQAEVAAQYLDKGRSVLIEGRLQQRRWETEDGQKRSKHEIVAEQVKFLGDKPHGELGDDQAGGGYEN